MFSFKPFQLHDYARIALTDGAILGHEPGLGKTIAAYAFAFLKCGFHQVGQSIQPKAPVLFVVPGDLHDQYINEGNTFFHTTVTRLDSQETFLHLATFNPPPSTPNPQLSTAPRSPLPAPCYHSLPPGFYITSYTQLGANRVAKLPSDKDLARDPLKLLDQLNIKPSQVPIAYATEWQKILNRKHCVCLRHFNLRGATNDEPAPEQFDRLSPEDQRLYTIRFARHTLKSFAENIGEIQKIKLQPGTAGILPARSSSQPSTLNPQPSTPPSSPAPRSQLHAPCSIPIKCLLSPSLADLCHSTFTCVIVDEGTKMKSDFAAIALGVRTLNPPFRFVATATPIKNRVPDLFHLLSWAVNGPWSDATARWPYTYEEKQTFAETFSVSELTISRKSSATGRQVSVHTRQKLTPQVCNVHKLWKLIAPSLLRRRKKDLAITCPTISSLLPSASAAQPIAEKRTHIVRVPMSTSQRASYQAHLKHYNPIDSAGNRATGAILAALRQAATHPPSAPLAGRTIPAPISQLPAPISQLHAPCSMLPAPCSMLHAPCSPTTVPGLPETPKLFAALNLITQFLERGEQFILFAPFLDPLHYLSTLLDSATVPHLVLTGETSQKKRSTLAALFKQGPPKYRTSHPSSLIPQPTVPAGILAGIECMAEGHNFPLCQNIIIYSYPWALDKILQAVDRVHRLNTPHPIDIYRLVTMGTIDRHMESQIDEKADSAELILDGHLIGHNGAELNLQELLKIAHLDFADSETTAAIPDLELTAQWPALQQRLRLASNRWRNPQPHPTRTYRPRTPANPATPATTWLHRYLARQQTLTSA